MATTVWSRESHPLFGKMALQTFVGLPCKQVCLSQHLPHEIKSNHGCHSTEMYLWNSRCMVGWMLWSTLNPTELFQQKPVIPKPSLETEASFIFFVPKAPIHFACSETWDCSFWLATQASSQNAMHTDQTTAKLKNLPHQILPMGNLWWNTCGNSSEIWKIFARHIHLYQAVVCSPICSFLHTFYGTSLSSLLSSCKEKQPGHSSTHYQTPTPNISSFFSPQSTY